MYLQANIDTYISDTAESNLIQVLVKRIKKL